MFCVLITLSQLHSNDKDEHSLCPRILPNLSVSLLLCLSTPANCECPSGQDNDGATATHGWVDATWSEGELALCCFENHSDMPVPAVKFTILVKKDFIWKAFFGAQRIETEPNHLLRDVPSILKSPNDVACLTTVIDSNKLCIGNHDARFPPLLSRREGHFKDQSGM